MRSRLDHASRLHFVAPWELQLKRNQWGYAQHLANFIDDSWQKLLVQWEPMLVLDQNLEFVAHRNRGRPRTRWDSDLIKFADHIWDSDNWLVSITNSSTQYLKDLEDAYVVFTSPI